MGEFLTPSNSVPEPMNRCLWQKAAVFEPFPFEIDFEL
jgi:hypothetical protein